MKVSIITVCKNSAGTIERTIQSVLNQDYENIEYIIVDGESSDGTLDIIKKYEDRISFWCSEPDKGIYDAMNKGIAHASGDIIGILNSDDWYKGDAVSKTVRKIKETQAEITYGNMEMINTTGVRQTWKPARDANPWQGMPWSHPTVFVTKKMYDEVGGFDTSYRIAADYKWLFERWIEGKKIVYIDAVITCFSTGGISNINNGETMTESIRVRREMIEYARINNNMADRASIELILGDEIIIHFPKKVNQYLKTIGIKSKEKVHIIGTGKWGRRVYDFISETKHIGLVTDNDADKWGQTFDGTDVPIRPVKSLENTDDMVIIAVRSDDATNCIIKQLSDLGVKRWMSLEHFRRSLGRAALEEQGISEDGMFGFGNYTGI